MLNKLEFVFISPTHSKCRNYYGGTSIQQKANGMKKMLFAITGVRYIEVLFHTFHYYWGRENRLLHLGLRYNRDLLYQDSTVADAEVLLISIYTLSDLGDLSNLIGSLSRTIQQYSPPSEWIMCELVVFPIF